LIRQEWLQAATPEAPCGPNLQYEQDFLALEQAARGREEQQYGETVIAAQEPDWVDVVKRASALLDRSRDIRIVHLLTRGLTRVEGMGGLRDGLGLARDLLDRFWDPVHPQLTDEGEPDPVLRANAVGSFGDIDGLVRDARAAIFLKCALGSFTVRDVEKILDPAAAAGEKQVSAEQLRAVIRDVLTADPAALVEAAEAIDALAKIRATMAAHLESTLVPDFAPLEHLLKGPSHFVATIRAEAGALAGSADAGAAAGAPAAAAPVAAGAGEIRTRDDAVRALERVCEFLTRNEPTNPAPLLIRRAQRLMTMPFMDIIRDLAPDATSQVEKITGANKN
jgi:type VI secretion system protein ImpA